MGEKSRGNWPVDWCGLKEKGCKGRCSRCVRRSEATVLEWREPGRPARARHGAGGRRSGR